MVSKVVVCLNGLVRDQVASVCPLGYKRNGILRTRTGNRISTNSKPVKLDFTGFWPELISPNNYSIQKVFIKVRYAFLTYMVNFEKYFPLSGYIWLGFRYVTEFHKSYLVLIIRNRFRLTATGIPVPFWFSAG